MMQVATSVNGQYVGLLLVLVYVGSRLVLRVSIIVALLYQMRRVVIAVEKTSRRRRRKFCDVSTRQSDLLPVSHK